MFVLGIHGHNVRIAIINKQLQRNCTRRWAESVILGGLLIDSIEAEHEAYEDATKRPF